MRVTFVLLQSQCAAEWFVASVAVVRLRVRVAFVLVQGVLAEQSAIAFYAIVRRRMRVMFVLVQGSLTQKGLFACSAVDDFRAVGIRLMLLGVLGDVLAIVA
jgi:hypothetical protein